jgi:hypothetical protein
MPDAESDPSRSCVAANSPQGLVQDAADSPRRNPRVRECIRRASDGCLAVEITFGAFAVSDLKIWLAIASEHYKQSRPEAPGVERVM